MAAPEPLRRTIQSIEFTDSEIRRIFLNGDAEAKKIMKALATKGTSSASIRSAQVAMARLNAELWANTKDATSVGIGDAVWNATEMQSLFDESLFKAAGVSSQYWRASMIMQAKVGIESVTSRAANGIGLSEAVYKNGAISKGTIDKILNNGLLLGKSAAEIAKDVSGYINPNTPGGVSYAAMRLGRTEVNNAFHTTSIRHYQNTPWIEQAKWNLSGSHARPDACNEYAENSWVPNGDAGVWNVAEIPAKPHPNCLCYVTPVPVGIDEFAKKFKDGSYDGYIHDTMGCYRTA